MARTLWKNAQVLSAAAVALLCTACVSAPQTVREQASGTLSCDASQVTVNRTERRYLGDDAYEAAGCGQKVTYKCERAYVLLIPVGTTACHKQ
ncbi:MAG TPA: hypothetical protein VGN07_22680 [Steroidobacteraceae bacterium]